MSISDKDLDKVFEVMEKLYAKTDKEVGLFPGESYVYAKRERTREFVFYIPFMRDEEKVKKGIAKLLLKDCEDV